ncbi:MAG: type II toxin-antitoxin system Phd/YefM family antitoxin [Proteobacteria bacterium]|nr:type II toxin-antitoxin system Phd/YefM family antitoxin [Pseudomonadota bacterium]
MMQITPTDLRQNLYNILDEIIDTGVPVEIKRKGKILRIVPERNVSVFDLLEKHDTIIGDAESLVHMDWSDTWEGDI